VRHSSGAVAMTKKKVTRAPSEGREASTVTSPGIVDEEVNPSTTSGKQTVGRTSGAPRKEQRNRTTLNERHSGERKSRSRGNPMNRANRENRPLPSLPFP